MMSAAAYSEKEAEINFRNKSTSQFIDISASRGLCTVSIDILLGGCGYGTALLIKAQN